MLYDDAMKRTVFESSWKTVSNEINERYDKMASGRVLILDDEESIRFCLREILSKEGYEVFTASTFEEAKDIISTVDIQAALIDLILSEEINGVEALKSIKTIRPLCQVIIISSYPSFDAAVEALKWESLAYLRKPMSFNEVIDIIRKAVQKSRRMRNLDSYEITLKTLMATFEKALFVLDSQNKVLLANPNFIRRFNWTPEEILGSDVSIIPDMTFSRLKSEAPKSGSRDVLIKKKTRIRTGKGEYEDVFVKMMRCGNGNSEPETLLCIIEDA